MFKQVLKGASLAAATLLALNLAGCSMFQSSGGATTTASATPEHVDMANKRAVSRHSNDMVWIRSQNPHHYTLQVYSTGSAGGVQHFNSQFEGSTTMYRYYGGGGQVRYGVIYGQFTTPEAAKAAIPRLPVSGIQVHAQVKSFGQLQNMMVD